MRLQTEMYDMMQNFNVCKLFQEKVKRNKDLVPKREKDGGHKYATSIFLLVLSVLFLFPCFFLLRYYHSPRRIFFKKSFLCLSYLLLLFFSLLSRLAADSFEVL